jgi:hypothetical protein
VTSISLAKKAVGGNPVIVKRHQLLITGDATRNWWALRGPGRQEVDSGQEVDGRRLMAGGRLMAGRRLMTGRRLMAGRRLMVSRMLGK